MVTVDGEFEKEGSSRGSRVARQRGSEGRGEGRGRNTVVGGENDQTRVLTPQAPVSWRLRCAAVAQRRGRSCWKFVRR